MSSRTVLDPYEVPVRQRGTAQDSETEVQKRIDRVGEIEEQEGIERWAGEPFELPGKGESASRCGEWYATGACETCGKIDLGTHLCGRRSCPGPEGDESPNCWAIWAKKASIRAATRIQSFRHTLPDNYERQVGHAVVSPEQSGNPEQDIRSGEEYWEGRKKAAKIAEEKGFRGFSVIPHPYRATKKAKAEYEEQEPDYGIWVWLRKDVENMSEYIYWSPHYHIIGLTTENMEEAKESDEWAYSLIRTLGEYQGVRDSESHEEVYGVFRYLLSHTGYPEGSTKQILTWHGDLANNKFVENPTEEWQHAKPSEGVISALEREIEKVADESLEKRSDVRETDEKRTECPCDGCDGEVIDVFDIESYLRRNNPPPDVREKMRIAVDWRLGRIEPPPGLKRPQSREQAEEVVRYLQE